MPELHASCKDRRGAAAPLFLKRKVCFMERISPFSIDHKWIFKPTLLLEDTKPGYAPLRAATEADGLRSIGAIGCIGSVQIQRLFQWKRHQVRRMIAEKKLVQHELTKNKNTIPVFTLGPRSAQLLKLSWANNEWRQWSIEQLISKLVFFQFCCALRDKQKAFHIQPAPNPFTGKVKIGEDIRNVLVLRGTSQEQIVLNLRHSSQPIIVIAESMMQTILMNEYLNHARLLLDEDLNKDYRFYRHINGTWYR